MLTLRRVSKWKAAKQCPECRGLVGLDTSHFACPHCGHMQIVNGVWRGTNWLTRAGRWVPYGLLNVKWEWKHEPPVGEAAS